MNIIHLTDYLPDYPGNFGYTLIAIVEKVSRYGGKCFVSFPEPRDWHEKIRVEGGEVIYLQVHKFKEKKIDLYSIKFLNHLIKKNKISLVHVHFGLSQKVTTLFLKFINPKLKVVWHWRGDVDDKKNKLKRLGYLLFYRLISDLLVNAHIANSKNIAIRLNSKSLVSSNKLFSLPNSINIKEFNSNMYKCEIEQLSEQYNTKNIFTLLMIRNFRRRVDFDIIIDTMEYLKNLPENIQLIWIGYGETETKIKSKVKAKKIDNIHFIGKVSNPVPFYYISKINIIAWEPWCKETINNTAYEALACNIPVVGLNFGGLPETFSEEEGVFTAPLDPKKYAEKILYIKNNYHKLKTNVFRGRKKVFRHFSLKSYVATLYDIYQCS